MEGTNQSVGRKNVGGKKERLERDDEAVSGKHAAMGNGAAPGSTKTGKKGAAASARAWFWSFPAILAPVVIQILYRQYNFIADRVQNNISYTVGFLFSGQILSPCLRKNVRKDGSPEKNACPTK